ncbi:MAG: beta-ketoacyl-[acyl-carrier-protein] synthase family protein [Phycisphaerae bacterium]|nr:beta-ketoacyl-[acyl-carrier-protein] synthase family protein [Phycisphaerae bacterium]
MSGRDDRRIVITGMGCVTPLGHDVETVWQNLLAGRSGIGPITHFDASTFPTTFSAEVRDYDFTQFVRHPEHHTHAGLSTRFALGAARQAWDMAGLDSVEPLDRYRVGIYLGSGEGTLDFDNYAASNLAGWVEETSSIDAARWAATAWKQLNRWTELEQEANMTVSHVATELEARGPAYNCLTACAASTQAIGEATEILRRGDADVMVSGGAHSMIHPLGLTGFNRLTALSNRNDDPTSASRPFNRTRDGFVLGEGSGIVILETLDHARERGATILGEIIGYGSSADAYRITDIQPEGRGPVAAMRQALEQAGLEPTQIDYISAHGTGTKENDSVETRAVKNVFGDNARQVPVSSIKSMMGHLIAAAGVVELIACVLAIRDQKVPPTINLDQPDPECDLDYVPNQSRPAELGVCLSNSFGFGGQNDTLIIQAPPL